MVKKRRNIQRQNNAGVNASHDNDFFSPLIFNCTQQFVPSAASAYTFAHMQKLGLENWVVWQAM